LSRCGRLLHLFEELQCGVNGIIGGERAFPVSFEGYNATGEIIRLKPVAAGKVSCVFRSVANGLVCADHPNALQMNLLTSSFTPSE